MLNMNGRRLFFFIQAHTHERLEEMKVQQCGQTGSKKYDRPVFLST